jgi:methionyl-tRNA formyltransferase
MGLAAKLKESGLDVRILTSPRLARERWDGAEFEAEMKRRGFPIWVQEELDLSRPPLSELDRSTLGLSLGAAWIFRPEAIRLFEGNLLNCHPSCLPEDRGGGGFSWRILRGDRRGRCLLHRVDAGVDSGEIIREEEFLFPEMCRIPRDFFEEQHARELAFLLEFARSVSAGAEFSVRPQDPAAATYWPRLETSLHGAIDWNGSAEEVERFVCAFDEPYVGAFTYAYNRRVHLKDCRQAKALRGSHPFLSGLIFRIHGGRLHVAAGEGQVSFGQVTDDEGRDRMGAFHPGDRLWTPSDVLQEARTTRVFQSSSRHYYRSQESLGKVHV